MVEGYILSKLKEGWRPEQIVGRLKREHRDDVVSHEADFSQSFMEGLEALSLFEEEENVSLSSS